MLPEDLKEAFDRQYRRGVLDIIEKLPSAFTQPLSGYIYHVSWEITEHILMSRSFWPKRSMNF
jgi:hypothetical protein